MILLGTLLCVECAELLDEDLSAETKRTGSVHCAQQITSVKIQDDKGVTKVT